jgi:tetratricopeptide (TPR) repeat protein
VTARLTALVRKELVRPDTPLLPGEDAFRFRHLLIRDAAYDGLPKATRAELHERFADWLERHGLDIVELDEILGYHLEQACRYRAELGTADDELGLRAAEHLGAAGRRAYGRSDAAAAVSLLGRAVELTPQADRDVAREIVLAEALFWVGRPQEAEARLSDTAAWACSRGDRIGELLALLDRAEMRMHTTLQTGVEELRAMAEEALPEFEKAGHEPALTKAWMAIGWAHHTQSRFAARNQAYEEALVHARRAQDEAMIRRVVVSLSAGYVLGPTPVEEALDWHLVQGELGFREQLNSSRAVLEAMQGHFAEARSSVAEERARCLEFGDKLGLGIIAEHEWYVEICAGDFPAAERVIREGCERLDEMGETGWLSTIAGRLARTLHTLERDDEAYEWSQRSEELGAKDDTTTQMLWRQARGTVLARRGEIEAGEKLLREALVLAQEADTLNENAEAHMDLAEVLDLAGRREEAGAEVEQALALYERKGNVVLAERARAKLDELRERSAARAPNG